MKQSIEPIAVAPPFSPLGFAERLRKGVRLRAGSPDEATLLHGVYRRGDRWMAHFMVIHLVLATALAPFHDTWTAALLIGGGAALAFFFSAWLWPGQLVTRMVAGVSLQAFCALHIFQMAGLTEMHFFFFTSVTAMIIYQDWRAFWPGVWAIIAQHTVFCHLHNQGIYPGGLRFFEPDSVSPLRMAFHFGIALAQVAIASYWAYVLRQQTLRDTSQRAVLDARTHFFRTSRPSWRSRTSISRRTRHSWRTPMRSCARAKSASAAPSTKPRWALPTSAWTGPGSA